MGRRVEQDSIKTHNSIFLRFMTHSITMRIHSPVERLKPYLEAYGI